jgi:large subunit ribosomal protein L25
VAKVVAVEGRTPGSAESRRWRRAGKLPAVLYGPGTAPRHLLVDAHEFVTALSNRVTPGSVLELEVGSTTLTVRLQEVQRHPVRRDLAHLDFLALDVREETEANVELVVDGEGILLEEASIVVRGKVRDLPAQLTIDLALFDGAEELLAGQLPLPKGLVLVTDPDTVLARLEPRS